MDTTDLLLVAVSTRGELARQYVSVHNPPPSSSKSTPSPGVFLGYRASSNKTRITLEEFRSDVAAKTNSTSTLTTSVQSPGLPVKLTKRKLPYILIQNSPVIPLNAQKLSWIYVFVLIFQPDKLTLV